MSTHVTETGCNLQREDFLPDDGPCADGGQPEEHPSINTDKVGTPWRSHFEALFRAVAACEAPEGTQVDDVLGEFQSTYDEIQEG